MKVPLLDLKLQHQKLQKELQEAFEHVLAHGQFILGPEVQALEKEIAQYCQAKYAISCASGSDALLLALMALDVGPGDEVITSPYSFFATASCVARIGARAVFADISLRDYNIDPAEVLKKISSKTKVIMPVHLYGQSAEMQPYLKAARERKIYIIEDAAQAIGAEYHEKPVGAIGDIGCLSFFPTKNLGGLGDGGMMLVNDDTLAEKLRVLRVHGAKPKYYHQLLGVNSRLDTLQAAWLHIKLSYLSKWAEARCHHALWYIRKIVESGLADEPVETMEDRGAPRAGARGTCGYGDTTPKLQSAFVHSSELRRDTSHSSTAGRPWPPAEAGGSKPLILPAICQSKHVFNQFVIRTRNPQARDPLRKHLESTGIGTEIYYPVPLHLQRCFACWNYCAGDFPKSELASASTLALPVFPELTESQLLHVIEVLRSFNWKSYQTKNRS